MRTWLSILIGILFAAQSSQAAHSCFKILQGDDSPYSVSRLVGRLFGSPKSSSPAIDFRDQSEIQPTQDLNLATQKLEHWKKRILLNSGYPENQVALHSQGLKMKKDNFLEHWAAVIASQGFSTSWLKELELQNPTTVSKIHDLINSGSSLQNILYSDPSSEILKFYFSEATTETESRIPSLQQKFLNLLRTANDLSDANRKVEEFKKLFSIKPPSPVKASPTVKKLIQELRKATEAGQQTEFVDKNAADLQRIYRTQFRRDLAPADQLEVKNLIYVYLKEFGFMNNLNESLRDLNFLPERQSLHIPGAHTSPSAGQLMQMAAGEHPWGWTSSVKLGLGEVTAAKSRSPLHFLHGDKAKREIFWWMMDEPGFQDLRVARNKVDGRVVSMEALMRNADGSYTPALYDVEEGILKRVRKVGNESTEKFCIRCHTGLAQGLTTPFFMKDLEAFKKEYNLPEDYHFNPYVDDSVASILKKLLASRPQD